MIQTILITIFILGTFVKLVALYNKRKDTLPYRDTKGRYAKRTVAKTLPQPIQFEQVAENKYIRIS